MPLLNLLALRAPGETGVGAAQQMHRFRTSPLRRGEDLRRLGRRPYDDFVRHADSPKILRLVFSTPSLRGGSSRGSPRWRSPSARLPLTLPLQPRCLPTTTFDEDYDRPRRAYPALARGPRRHRVARHRGEVPERDGVTGGRSTAPASSPSLAMSAARRRSRRVDGCARRTRASRRRGVAARSATRSSACGATSGVGDEISVFGLSSPTG